MLKLLFNIPIYPLLLALVFMTSCNGQVKMPEENANDSVRIANRHSKMLKTQGKYTYRTATGPYSDTSVSISAIMEDKQGNIWIASMGEGVYRYDGKSFTNYTVKDGLITNLVYSMLQDTEGNIWFGTTDGVSRYNGKTFTNFPFSIISGNAINQFSKTSSDPLKEHFKSYKEVWCMFQDRTGKIWLGTSDGVYRYDGKIFTSLAKLDSSKNSSIRHVSVTAIVEDNSGNIWFTSWADGLCKFDGKSITKISPEGEGFNSMLLDKNGYFWLGRRNVIDGSVYHYDGRTFVKLHIGISNVLAISQDGNGNIWFSEVPHGGVIHYNPQNSMIIARYSIKNGLANNNIHCITIDKSGKVWFGSQKLTLSFYDGKSFTHFPSE